MTVDDKGTVAWALDTKIERDADAGILKISQTAYTEKFLSEHRMAEFKKVDTPMVPGFTITDDDLPKTDEEKAEVAKLPFREVIGKLWWLALISRPDIVMPTHFVDSPDACP
jgi:hypothetical protein